MRRASVAVTMLIAAFAAAPFGPAAAPQVSAPQRFTVTVDGHPLAVWARVPASPRRAIVLVHGRTWSSRPDFDLQVPGLHRSVMQSLADRGIAAYAVDLRGYGETPRDPSGFTTPNRSAADVAAVLRWVASRHASLGRPTLLGWSNGAVVAQHVAQLGQVPLAGVILFGYTPTPTVSFADEETPDAAPREKNTAAAAASDFIAPDVTEPAVIHAFVAQALAADPIFAEWRRFSQWDILRADKLKTPVLIIHGELDPGADPDAAKAFLAAVKSPLRHHIVLPGADHCAQLENTHGRFVDAVVHFIDEAAHPVIG
jgi:pimeloyl-ACP methyl ester carboxylesterase